MTSTEDFLNITAAAIKQQDSINLLSWSNKKNLILYREPERKNGSTNAHLKAVKLNENFWLWPGWRPKGPSHSIPSARTLNHLFILMNK